MPVFLCFEDCLLPLRTRIYIDDYNLYYGCLTKASYKWLDVLALFETGILPTILHQSAHGRSATAMELLHQPAIKYFTADIIETAAKAFSTWAGFRGSGEKPAKDVEKRSDIGLSAR